MPRTADTSTRVPYGGDGRDGSIAYNAANARWEDGHGNALANESRWTGVSTTTLILLRECYFRNVTVPQGATLQLGAPGTHGGVQLNFNGLGTFAGTLTAGTAGAVSSSVAPAAGAARTTVGAGNASAVMLAYLRHGVPGAGGGGGGDGVNAGGSRSVIGGVGTQAAIASMLVAQGSSVSAGTTGAGADGIAPPDLTGIVSQFNSAWMQLPSACGLGGSGGSLKQAGGTNKGGAGGAGGDGKLPLRIRGNRFELAATAVINNNGGSGAPGENGIATNAAGDISGGGGGGGGGAGGAIAIEYLSWNDAGATITAHGGTGGARGLGFEFNAVARPASHGGNGEDGTDGIVLVQQFGG